MSAMLSNSAMECPYCANTFALTWRRYASAPLGRHSCPSCGRKSKLGSGPIYWLLYVPLMVCFPLIALVAGVVVFAYLSPEHPQGRLMPYFGGWLWVLPPVVALALIFPIDRIVDERLRKLQPIEGK